MTRDGPKIRVRTRAGALIFSGVALLATPLSHHAPCYDRMKQPVGLERQLLVVAHNHDNPDGLAEQTRDESDESPVMTTTNSGSFLNDMPMCVMIYGT